MRRIALRCLLLSGLLLSGLLGVAQFVSIGTDFFITNEVTWSQARDYCRQNYTDLSSINNEEENALFKAILVEHMTQRAWIGLYKDANNTWRWAGGTAASYFDWAPRNKTDEEGSCVVLGRRGWRLVNCEAETYNFLCFQSDLVLVKEKKTWEEALGHCRLLNMDLMSLLSQSAVVPAMQMEEEAQTSRVWTSLRYLGDRWFWADRSIQVTCATYQAWNLSWEMPKCPAWRHHCGAISLEGQNLESWDCADALNFLCYKNTLGCPTL